MSIKRYTLLAMALLSYTAVHTKNVKTINRGVTAFSTMPYQAGKNTGLGLSKYMGMTADELAAVFKKESNAYMWRFSPPLDCSTCQGVSWFYRNTGWHKSLAFSLSQGRVKKITFYNHISASDDFEDLCNRHLKAVSTNQWLDEVSHTKWKMSRDIEREDFWLEVTR